MDTSMAILSILWSLTAIGLCLCMYFLNKSLEYNNQEQRRAIAAAMKYEPPKIQRKTTIHATKVALVSKDIYFYGSDKEECRIGQTQGTWYAWYLGKTTNGWHCLVNPDLPQSKNAYPTVIPTIWYARPEDIEKIRPATLEEMDEGLSAEKTWRLYG